MRDAVLDASARPRLDDRINPILVKEVRQSLRGKYFRVLFWLTLGVGTLIGLSIVSNAAGNENVVDLGQAFFMSIFGVMSAAVHGFVPFSAFLSTSAEWDENTYDLLVISNLKPRQIVLGKLLSALIQALLYYSTFGPFLVFAFLMNGVDLLSVVVILIGSMATCIALTLVGIAASSLTATKVGRVVLMAIFGAGLVGAWGMSMGLAGAITFEPQNLRDVEGQSAVAGYLSAAFIVALLATAVAMARFSHEEENRSTGLRVLATLVIVAATAWGAWMRSQFGDVEFIWISESIAAGACFLLWIFFMTEPEELGRRVEKHMPQHPVLALLASPFYPGGGRAVLLFALHAALATVGSQLALSFGTSHPGERMQTLSIVLALYGYAFFYIAIPAAVAAFFVRTHAMRMLIRIGIFLAFPVSIILPVLIGLFARVDSWMEFEHPFNPFWVLMKLDDASLPFAVVMTLWGLGVSTVLGILLNLPRVLRGLHEVATLRRRRRSVESAQAAA